MSAMITECYTCIHARSLPGNTHIACVKLDPLMTGDAHGVMNGWFFYPYLFDPTWKTRLCTTRESRIGDTPCQTTPV